MIARILDNLKGAYWSMAREKQRKAKLGTPALGFFADYIRQEKERVITLADQGIDGEIDERLKAAVDWILRAQKATPDDGVPVGYFPVGAYDGWMPSYPETTGYIITSLLKYADIYQAEEVREAALKMADWEIDIQMPGGAVQGGPVCAPEKQTAAAFNTGMVLDGWCSAFELTGEQKYLQAARRAAEFLANDLDDAGYFQTNGDFVSQGEIKTYTCLCSWAMYRAGELLDRQDIRDAAVRSVEAAIRQQRDNGWFAYNCLTHPEVPLTHTIGYAIQGIFEVGVLSDRQDFVDAAVKSLRAVVANTQGNGYLVGRLDQNWRPACNYVCLTGSVQLAIVCYRLKELFADDSLYDVAERLTDFVKAAQLLETERDEMRGAIAGSFPITEDYMRDGYPNWATKYYIDALLLQKDLRA